MKSKTLEKYLDRLFWFILLILPLLILLVTNRWTESSFISVLSQFNINNTNIIYSVLNDIFGSNGILPFVNTVETSVVLLYLSYMVLIELVHIVVDVILFLPRIAVKLLDGAVEMGDGKKW